MHKSDLRYKTLLIPIAIVIILGAGANTTEAFSKRKQDKPNLTEEQRDSLSEARKLLKQGGSFKINGVLVEVKPTDKMLTSRGEQDGGVIQVDAFARF